MKTVANRHVSVPEDARFWLMSSEPARLIESGVQKLLRWEDDCLPLFELQAFRERVAWELDRIMERLAE